MSEGFYKVVIIGNGAVGKTTMLNRHLTGLYTHNTAPTVGVDLKQTEISDFDILSLEESKSYTDKENEWSKKNKFRFWDLGGQHMFDQLRPSYFKGTHGIMLCFSLNDERSFGSFSIDGLDHSIGRFLLQLINFFGKEEFKNIPILLVGTKNDLPVRVKNKQINRVIKLLRKRGINLISYLALSDLLVCGHWSIGKENSLRNLSKRWVSLSSKTGNNVNVAFKLIEIAVIEQEKYNNSCELKE